MALLIWRFSFGAFYRARSLEAVFMAAALSSQLFEGSFMKTAL
ncbi:MAG: hypothetical protein AAFY07_10180 [Pseudomonadota bacterium]